MKFWKNFIKHVLIFDNFSLSSSDGLKTVIAALRENNKAKICFGISDESLVMENIEYLKEVFSDSMLFVNPVGGQLNKAGFIAGVEGLYEMFDDISIEEMNGDAIGAEVETVTYKNGIVWTNIWNKKENRVCI